MKKTIKVPSVLLIKKKRFKGNACLYAVPEVGNVFVVAGNTFTCTSMYPQDDGTITAEMIDVLSEQERLSAEKRLLSAGFILLEGPQFVKKTSKEELLMEC